MSNPRPTSRIFVSHSSKDNTFGIQLAGDLRQALGDEDSVWYDSSGGLLGGDSWIDKIVEELSTRDTFLVILSPDANDSLWVKYEIDIALAQRLSKGGNKRIVPIFHRTCPLLPKLIPIQGISFISPKTYQTALNELLLALGLTPGKIPPGTTVAQPGTGALIQQLSGKIKTAFTAQKWHDVIIKADFLIQQVGPAVPSDIYHMQGMAFYQTGNYTQAQKALLTALAYPQDLAQYMRIMTDYATMLNKQQLWNELFQVAQEALQIQPGAHWWLMASNHASKKLLLKTPSSTPSTSLNTPSTPPNTPSTPQPAPQTLGTFGAYRALKRLEKYTSDQFIVSQTYLGESLYNLQKPQILIKSLHPALTSAIDKNRFLYESRSLQQLQHPHILSILDQGLAQDIPFLILENHSLKTLRDRHPYKSQLPLATVGQYVQQIATILQYVHDQHQIHGNLQPESVLQDTGQHIMLSNFRIAVVYEHQYQSIGHSPYIAPEQIQGQMLPANDQYALALMAYEWITGALPSVEALATIGLWSKHDTVLPAPIRAQFPGFPVEAEKALVRALALAPEKRFASILSFASTFKLAC